ncbi:hypothetical protein [Streptomyces sp. YGL11-2]|uniref:hypothetical protein n=1 Tax=Streptomyces sp. YGL11-2 TaxID=3414028 RepID=UPI003CF19B79
MTAHDELAAFLQQIGKPHAPINRGPIVVRVCLSRHDYPEALTYQIQENCPPPSGAVLKERVT